MRPDDAIKIIMTEAYLSKFFISKEFLKSYVTKIIENESFLVEKIKNQLDGWTYERLGTVEKVLLKIAFYEIIIEKVGHEIAINEVLELSKIYGDAKSKDFINGILADFLKKED